MYMYKNSQERSIASAERATHTFAIAQLKLRVDQRRGTYLAIQLCAAAIFDNYVRALGIKTMEVERSISWGCNRAFEHGPAKAGFATNQNLAVQT
ncbi:hypothetical protein TWF751_003447 [Orbilia oligospora]|nr:hypothetical protein TWF751_003447 [Orbilia oligospora]